MLAEGRSALLRLLRGPATRGVLVLSAGTGVGQGIVLASAPILTRLYDPSAFGVFGVYFSLASLLAIAATLRYDYGILLSETEEDSRVSLALSLLVLLIATIIISVSILAGRSTISGWMPGLASFAPWSLLPVTMMAMGTQQAANAWHVRRRSYGPISLSKVTNSGLTASGQLFLGIGNPGAGSLAAGEAFGRSLASVLLLRRALPSLLSRATWEPSQLVRAARRYARFPLFATPSSILTALSVQAPILLFAAHFGARPTGAFVLAQRVGALPMALLGQAAASVYSGELASERRERPEHLPGLLRRWLIKLGPAALGLALMIALFGRFGVSIVFGPEWRETGIYLQLLSLMLAIQLIVAPLGQTLYILERQRLQLVWDISRVGSVVLVFFVGARLGASPGQLVGGYSAIMTLNYVILAAMGFRAATYYGQATDEVHSKDGLLHDLP